MNQIPEKLLKPYNPKETEERIYKAWEDGGFFNPEICIKKGFTKADAEPYTIVLPPPNVTGILHMGHALMVALEDLLIRFHRMRGRRTLWLPGTDHAAIATQAKVEKDISKKEGKSRHDLGREELLKRINSFAQESHDTIVEQIKRTGASVDWSREAFTLDEKRNFAVRTAFKNMYDDGLIYQGKRIVNWDPKGQTTISDDEIVYETRKAKLYTFKYSKDFPISISTTRPETKVGDTAVAVHPNDPRYAKYVGKEYKTIFAGVPLNIKIVADEEVRKDFGTGALGVTPAHSQIDWTIAQKNNLPIKQVIDEYARMTVETPELKGKKVAEAREIIVTWLKNVGLLEKEEEIEQNVATAERTGGIIEPLPKLQWFIAVNKKFTLKNSQIEGIPAGSETTLKEIMTKVVVSKQIKIIPDYFDKTYFHWIENLRDWCISRQIWYGHRIPVWYKGKEIYCGVVAPTGEGWTQDEDTLDTWFSSGLWTFSTLGWPEKTEDLKIYHPTDVLETGYEILFFWVARMILMTGYHLGQIPFHTVYLHGTVRDAKGRKMSKSLGNGIDPIEIADKYGADAGRMALIMSGSAGTDSKLSEDKIKGYKHFANKIWNITRFVLDNGKDYTEKDLTKTKLLPIDQKLLDALDTQVADITKDIEEYRFYMAAEKIYHYIWHEFADTILEQSKTILSGTDEAAKKSRQQTLFTILTTSLKILHPFMPFVTEELWSVIPNTKRMLIVENWPIINQ
jgi:valyl-tRNA synthetase